MMECVFKTVKVTIISVVIILALTNSVAYADVSQDVQVDILKHRLLESIQNEQHGDTLQLLKELRVTGKPLGNEIFFFEARALFETGQAQQGEAVLNHYIKQAGRSGANYDAAIGMLSELMNRRDEEHRIAEEKARRETEAKRKAKAYFDSLIRQGTVSRINAEWSYVVVTKSTTAVESGKSMFIYTDAGNKIPLGTTKAISDTEFSASAQSIDKVAVGMLVYSEP